MNNNIVTDDENIIYIYIFRTSGTGTYTYVCCILCKNHTGTRNLPPNSFGIRDHQYYRIELRAV